MNDIKKPDNIYKEKQKIEDFSFNEKVTEIFDDMLIKSSSFYSDKIQEII